MHTIMELYTTDFHLHGAVANYRCAMLEGLHLMLEKNMYLSLNKKDIIGGFAQKVCIKLIAV